MASILNVMRFMLKHRLEEKRVKNPETKTVLGEDATMVQRGGRRQVLTGKKGGG